MAQAWGRFRRYLSIAAALGVVVAGVMFAAPPGRVATAQAVTGSEFVVSTNADVFTRTLDVVWHGFGWVAVWSEHPDHSLAGGVEVHNGDDAIRAQFILLDGTLDGGDFQVAEGGGSKDFPAIAHLQSTSSTTRQESLVVWMDDRDGEDDIWAQLIAKAGVVLSGSNFKLSGAGADRFPDVAYGATDSNSGVFLAVWENETSDGESDVLGQLINGPDSLGTLVGSNFTISEATSGLASAPTVAYDPFNDQFLVVWTDSRGGSAAERDIWGQYVAATGALVGTNFLIGSSSDLDRAPEVLFHPVAQEYLVAWNHEPAGLVESYLQRITAAGGPTGPVIVASSGANDSPGGLAIDAATGNYVVPINVNRTAIEVQRVAVDGTLIGGREPISTDTTANKGPAVTAYGSTPVGPGAGVAAVSEMLMVWRDARNADADFESEVFGRLFDIEADSDGDGLLDSWETSGFVDNNGNGVLDGSDFDFTTLPAANQPDPMHKDIYVEVDWMEVDADGDGVVTLDPDSPGDHTHAMAAGTPGSTPTGTPLDAVIAAFANAPVTNPDGMLGINMHIDVGQMGGGGPIAETLGVDFDSGFEAVKLANFDVRRQRVFHYALRKHGGSGRAEIWGNDFWWNYTTATTQATGFMHELGHNLNLRHGGGDNINCKPNYFSIMNYTHQLTGMAPAGTMDYSRNQLPVLDESNLNEAVTLGDGNFQTIFSAGTTVVGPSAATAGNVRIDWDNDGTPDESGSDVGNNDLNVFDQCNGAPAGPSPNEFMNGFNDWPNLRYNFMSSPHFVDGIHSYSEEDGDRTPHEDFIREVYGEPVVVLSLDGTPSGLPGDTVQHVLEIDNVGEGPARETVVSFTVPAGVAFSSLSEPVLTDALNSDGSRSVTTVIENIDAGAAASITLDGALTHPPVAAVVTVDALVEARNALGEDVGQTHLASFDTAVLFPEIDIAKSSDAQAAPGAAITHTITVENVGTAAATALVTDTLPDGLVYSAALDGGAGPMPGAVTENADGTTTLTWDLGRLEVGETVTIEYHARWSLLEDPGDTVTNMAAVSYIDDNTNPYGPEVAEATTQIVFVQSHDPLWRGPWRVRDALRTEAVRAAVQITDGRYDGTGGAPTDGVLDDGETRLALGSVMTLRDHLAAHMLATLLNLADQRLASTMVADSEKAAAVGVTSVREAVEAAQAILDDGTGATAVDYIDLMIVLDEINKGRTVSGP